MSFELRIPNPRYSILEIAYVLSFEHFSLRLILLLLFQAPYIVYIEVVLCDNVFASPLPMKQSDSKLRSTRSEENLTLHQMTALSGYTNCETQSLDSELIDSYRSFVNSEDADIWSTSDDVNGDDSQQQQQQQQHQSSQQAVSRRNGLIGYRSNQAMNINPETQSIRSNESHLSQQEIMPSDIRKRLTEVKNTGPILFDVRI